MITTLAATDNSFMLGSPSPQNVSQVATECLNTLRRFVARGQTARGLPIMLVVGTPSGITEGQFLSP